MPVNTRSNVFVADVNPNEASESRPCSPTIPLEAANAVDAGETVVSVHSKITHSTNADRTLRTTTIYFYDGTTYSFDLNIGVLTDQVLTNEEKLAFFKNYYKHLNNAIDQARIADLICPTSKGEGAKLVEDIRTLRDQAHVTISELGERLDAAKPTKVTATKTKTEGKSAKYPFYKTRENSYQYLRNFKDALTANEIDTEVPSKRFIELLIPKLNNIDREKFRNKKDLRLKDEPPTWIEVCNMFLEAVTVGDVKVINLDRYTSFERYDGETIVDMNRRFLDVMSYASISPTDNNTHLHYLKHLADISYANANTLIKEKEALGLELNILEIMKIAATGEKQSAPKMPEYIMNRREIEKISGGKRFCPLCFKHVYHSVEECVNGEPGGSKIRKTYIDGKNKTSPDSRKFFNQFNNKKRNSSWKVPVMKNFNGRTVDDNSTQLVPNMQRPFGRNNNNYNNPVQSNNFQNRFNQNNNNYNNDNSYGNNNYRNNNNNNNYNNNNNSNNNNYNRNNSNNNNSNNNNNNNKSYRHNFKNKNNINNSRNRQFDYSKLNGNDNPRANLPTSAPSINRITPDEFFSYSDTTPAIRRYTLPGSNVTVGEDIIIPLRVEGKKIKALVDSGAKVSTIFKDWVSKNLGSHYVRPFSQDLVLADGSKFGVKELCEWPRIETDKTSILSDLLIIDSPGQSQLPYNMIIGLDLMPRLGMQVINLPIDYASITDQERETKEFQDIYEERYNIRSLPDLTEKEKADSELIKREIQKVLERNQELRDDAVCTIPDSMVYLDTQGHPPVFTRQYRLNQNTLPAVRTQIETWLKNGVIGEAPIGTIYNSPLLAVPKKDELTNAKTNTRVCMDVRALNNLLKDDKYPIPNIKHVLDTVIGFRYYTVFDLKDGYNHFPINEEDQPKLAFTFERKQYMFLRAPFGLKHLPSLFQRVISSIFKDMPNVISYIDDIVIFSNDIDTMIQTIRTAVFRLTKAGMKIKITKSHIGLPRIQLLGHTVSHDGVSPDRFKVNNLLKWPEPRSAKDMQSFLGLANYFSDYIPFYSTLSAPLNRLRTMKEYDWSKPYEGMYKEAFVKLKAMLSECLTLHYPDFNARFYLATDASTFGIAGILLQYVDDKPRYISFMSRSLTKAERNYSATKLELTAILYCLKRSEYYLFGRKFLSLQITRLLLI